MNIRDSFIIRSPLLATMTYILVAVWAIIIRGNDPFTCGFISWLYDCQMNFTYRQFLNGEIDDFPWMGRSVIYYFKKERRDYLPFTPTRFEMLWYLPMRVKLVYKFTKQRTSL